MEEKEKELFELAISTFTQDWKPEKDLMHSDRGYIATNVIKEAVEEILGEEEVTLKDVSLWMHGKGFRLEWSKHYEGLAWVVWDLPDKERTSLWQPVKEKDISDMSEDGERS